MSKYWKIKICIRYLTIMNGFLYCVSMIMIFVNLILARIMTIIIYIILAVLSAWFSCFRDYTPFLTQLLFQRIMYYIYILTRTTSFTNMMLLHIFMLQSLSKNITNVYNNILKSSTNQTLIRHTNINNYSDIVHLKRKNRINIFLNLWKLSQDTELFRCFEFKIKVIGNV